jgi:hypothetical protein
MKNKKQKTSIMTKESRIRTRSSSAKVYNVENAKTQIKTFEGELKYKTNEYDQSRHDVEKESKEEEIKYENSKKRKFELTVDTSQREEFINNTKNKIQDALSKILDMEKIQQEAEEKQRLDTYELNHLTRYIEEEYPNKKSKNIQKLASLKDEFNKTKRSLNGKINTRKIKVIEHSGLSGRIFDKESNEQPRQVQLLITEFIPN